MTLGFEDLLDGVFYEGLAGSEDVPGRWDVALNGVGLVIDWEKFEFGTVEMLRQATDQGTESGEQSRTNEGFWLRAGVDWRMGAGQEYFDRPDSDRRRFDSSRGVDVWTRGKASMHHDTELVDAATATNLRLFPVGGFIYKVEGSTLAYSTTGASGSFTTVTTTGLTTITGITVDGARVFVCDGVKVMQTTAGDAAAADWHTYDADRIWYSGGRIFASNEDVLVELSSDGTTATTVKDHAIGSMDWVGGCAAPNGFYAACTAGTLSEIWFVGVKDDGTLAVPISATPWPLEEAIRDIAFNGGIFFIATSLGYRLAVSNSDGTLNYGALTEIPGGVNRFWFRGGYAWFTWTNYDGTYTGLGRMNIGGEFVDLERLVPARASDLMAATQGEVLDVVSFNSTIYFAVSAVGFYREADSLVATAELDTGWITYNDPEDKVTGAVAIRHDPLAGSIRIDLVHVDDDTYTCGTSQVATSREPASTFMADLVAVDRVQLRFTWNRDAGDDEAGPALTLWKLLSLPTGTRVNELILPVMSSEQLDESEYFSPTELFEWLQTLASDRTIVVFQMGRLSWRVVVDRVFIREPDRWNEDHGFLDGNFYVRLLTLEI